MARIALNGPAALLILVGSAWAGPLVGPPLPLDEKLAAVAPEECLWYLATSGCGEADAGSSNHTEQLLAEPQVRRFVSEIETQVTAAVRRFSGAQREQRVLAAELPKVLRLAVTRPWAVYLEDIALGENRSVTAEAGLVLNVGDRRDELKASLAEIFALATEKGLSTTEESAGGVTWQRVALPPQAPAVRFGWKDDYFVIAVGEKSPQQILDRMDGEAPKWLAQLRDEHPIDREQTVSYLDVARLLERIQPLVEKENAEAWHVVEVLGLTNIRALHGRNGLDEVGCVSMAHAATDGQRPGLLAFLPYQPLGDDDVALVPKDALLAVAYRLDASELLDKGIALAAQFDPRAKENVETHLWQLESHLGVNLRGDVLGSLGDVWVGYVPGGDLMSSWLNSAIAVRVRDASKLRAALGKLVEIAKAEMARNGGRASIAESTNGGRTLYTLQFQSEPVPVAPTWCIGDEWLVIGLLPQAVQSALDRRAEDSLTQSAEIQAVLAEKPAALVYQDTPQLMRSVYPWLQIAISMGSAQARKMGVNFDATALPSSDTVIKHLRPSVGAVFHKEDGFHFISRGTAPGGGNAVGAAPIMVGLLLPAVQSARQAARDQQEMNNLRQLALAVMNYEAVHGALPTDVYDDEGNALLSWRVQLLPYLEENLLYSQFKLNEPWDSATNRPLLDRMPPMFHSPASDANAVRTRYLSFSSDASLFPGQESVRFRDITDGTSNTLLFVQAAPDAEVEWTKPASIKFEPSHPFAGVANDKGFFLAAFCDGSVHRLSLAIGADTMRALVTRNGEEPISYDELLSEPAPHLYDASTPGGVIGQ